MTLYGTMNSPYVRHARIALAQTALEWNLEKVTPKTIHNSPTKRVPFLIDGDITLTDSAVIIRYVREQSGQPFLENIIDHELFNLSTSVLDTAVNLFLMNIGDSNDLSNITSGDSPTGFSPQQYVERQQQRIASGIEALNNFDLTDRPPFNDGEIRLACLLDWGVKRQVFNLNSLDNLKQFLVKISNWQIFSETTPQHKV